MDDTRRAVDHGARVAAGVDTVVPDDLRGRPRRAAVGKALEQQVDVAHVAGPVAAPLAERKQQEAVHEASQIMAKAREAAQLEHEQLMSQLKREFGRMVADATSRVTGKVLTNDDQDRINKESAAQVSA